MKFKPTDSTALVMYEPKQKKPKKQKVWLFCILTALISSSISSLAVGGGVYYYLSKNAPQNQTTINSTSNVPSPSLEENLTVVSNKITSKNALSVTEIAEKVGPSCVGVINKAKVTPTRYYDPWTGRFYYTNEGSDTDLIQQGSGSGIIISNDGYIVTNQHVIDGATEISVILNTGDEYVAKLVGQDAKSDLAVLKIDKTDLPAATLGISENVRVGELAVAIGNPLGQELAGTVTAGVISAVNRTMTVDQSEYNLLQTDAAINPGNSGGALVNQYGEVIGINTIKLSDESVEGIGFAIATDIARPIIEDLIKNGYVTGRPWLGVSITQTRNGLSVDSVEKGSGAEKAVLESGDLIVKADGQVVNTFEALNKVKDAKKPGEKIKLTVIRRGEMVEIDVTLGESIPTE